MAYLRARNSAHVLAEEMNKVLQALMEFLVES